MRLFGFNNIARALNGEQVPAPVVEDQFKLPPPPSDVKVFSGGRSVEGRRSELRKTSQETSDAIQKGRYEFNSKIIDLRVKTQESCKGTKFYNTDSVVKEWATSTPIASSSSSNASSSGSPVFSPTQISVLQISTIDAARLLDDMHHNNPSEAGNVIGVLNFASPLKPGGAFLGGSDGQEQSIARASTLHSTLGTSEARQFYKQHGTQKQKGYYSHGMIYSPKVTVFRDDDGHWARRFEVDVLSCAAVNVNMVLNNNEGASKAATLVTIEKEMKERMGRILFLFEHNGVRDVILGAFGTGTFYNDVETVARLWAELLVVPCARFQRSFDRVIFAIVGKPTYDLFNNAFMAWDSDDL